MGLRAIVAVAVLCGALLAGAGAASAQGLSEQQKALLQEELNQITNQINTLRSSLDSTKVTQSTLQGQLKALNDQIKLSELAIRRRNLSIQALQSSIAERQRTIEGLGHKLGSEKESLAAILRATDRIDNASLLVAVLTAPKLSDFFADLAQFGQINERMQESFEVIHNDTSLNESQKAELESQLAEQTQLRQVQQLEESQLQIQKRQKNNLIAATKGQEKEYQKLIASKQQTAAQIRAALFELSGTRAIPFGTALQYANLAAEKTGIRPAFLLGIIAEESNLGENVGSGTWAVDMGPGQKAMFQVITSSLGLNPDTVPVSKKPWYGYGGAMGPAQFIPNTWASYAGYQGGAYDPGRDRIGALTGSKPPNPWNPADAFMAAALYLTDNGAAARTSSAEFRAAMCYLAGCGGINNRDLQFYGNDVARLAAGFQAQIDILKKSGS